MNSVKTDNQWRGGARGAAIEAEGDGFSFELSEKKHMLRAISPRGGVYSWPIVGGTINLKTKDNSPTLVIDVGGSEGGLTFRYSSKEKTLEALKMLEALIEEAHEHRLVRIENAIARAGKVA